jgi:hypothetical protein
MICNSTAMSAITAAITVALGCVSQGSFRLRRRFSIMFFLSFYLLISKLDYIISQYEIFVNGFLSLFEIFLFIFLSHCGILYVENKKRKEL